MNRELGHVHTTPARRKNDPCEGQNCTKIALVKKMTDEWQWEHRAVLYEISISRSRFVRPIDVFSEILPHDPKRSLIKWLCPSFPLWKWGLQGGKKGATVAVAEGLGGFLLMGLSASRNSGRWVAWVWGCCGLGFIGSSGLFEIANRSDCEDSACAGPAMRKRMPSLLRGCESYFKPSRINFGVVPLN
ncbi:MAG: hypothetical protein GHCLOJNM_02071 [bacterium]|nr:hypothetical protein [bacterium]